MERKKHPLATQICKLQHDSPRSGKIKREAVAETESVTMKFQEMEHLNINTKFQQSMDDKSK